MSVAIAIVLSLPIGAALGALVTWILRSRHVTALRTRLASVEADRDARLELVAQSHKEFKDDVRGVAAQLSQDTRANFMKEFEALTERQTSAASAKFSTLVEPIQERLKGLEEYASNLHASTNDLSSHIHDLNSTLTNSQRRGKWGEEHLQNTIEAAGLSRPSDFETQVKVTDPRTGKARILDVIVNVPGDAKVIIDSKAPFDAYYRAIDAPDKETQRREFENHAERLKNHAKDLGSRNYSELVPGSLNFVLMYVPIDPMLDAAMDVDGAFWQKALQDHQVLITSPGLLIAYLKTVAMTWRQHEVAQHAKEIAELGNELYGRIGVYFDHVINIGSGLSTAVDAYNKSMRSFNSRLLPQAKKFRDLGSVGGDKQLPKLEQIGIDVESFIARELPSGED